MGLGTDIGGSLRIPSAWCGLYTLKATPQKSSVLGLADTDGVEYFVGLGHIATTSGAMTRSVDDLILYHQIAFDHLYEYDKGVINKKFDHDLYNKTL